MSSSPGMQRFRRGTARSSSSHQVPGDGELYEDDDLSLVYSSHGDTRRMIMLSNSQSMTEHLRSKLDEKLNRSFGDFLTVSGLSQNENGKIQTVECFMNHRRLIITCQSDGSFVVFSDSNDDMHFKSWLNVISDFGTSGRCASLSALFEFAFATWNSHTKSQTIDHIGVSNDNTSVLSTLLSRASAHLNDGIYSLALSDANEALRLLGYSDNDDYLSQQINIENMKEHAEFFYVKGVALERLGRLSEALDAYIAATELDPTNERARDCFVSVFEVISNNQSNASPLRGRLDSRGESVVGSGTTASRWSSRSTTPTSCTSERFQPI